MDGKNAVVSAELAYINSCLDRKASYVVRVVNVDIQASAYVEGDAVFVRDSNIAAGLQREDVVIRFKCFYQAEKRDRSNRTRSTSRDDTSGTGDIEAAGRAVGSHRGGQNTSDVAEPMTGCAGRRVYVARQ